MYQLEKNITDIFAEIVVDMNTDLLAGFQAYDPKIQQISYQHGHLQEIIETLIQYDKTESKRYKKYPLVILIEDIKERHGQYFTELDLNIILVFHTKKDYKSQERYEKTFNPILLPMYENLMNALFYNKYLLVNDVSQIDHTKTNRLYWGREALAGNTANKTGDAIDAVEINIRNLKQVPAFCENPISPNN